MPLKFWTNQSFKIQSALAAAQAITAISKASPGVVTTSGTLPSNGQYALIEGNSIGMNQVNKRVFKVAGASGSNFNIGVDTTLYSTYVAGGTSFRIATFGLAFASARDIQSSGGDPIFEDTTTIHDSQDNQAIISSSPQNFSFTVDWDPTDPALIACNAAFISKTPLCFSLADNDGTEYLFNAYVNAPMNPTVSGKKKVTPVSLALRNTGTAY